MSRAPRRFPSGRLRWRDRIAFRLERFVLRGIGQRLLLAAGVIVLTSVVGGLLAYWLVGDLEAAQAIWWAFLRLSDPGYLGDDDGVTLRGISTVVTVLGYVLFLGFLIAIMTHWLNQKLQYLESGVTPIALQNHVIIFGWTARTTAIVRGLLGAGRRLDRFLAEVGARDLRIVVLVDEIDDGIRREMRDRLGDMWSDRHVFLRSGSPLRAEHLDRVAIRDASVLILPGADFGEAHPEAVDAKTIKELLAISRNASLDGTTPPPAVAELFDIRRLAVARRAYRGESEMIAADDIVSRIITQSGLQRGLGAVYSELLTLNDRNSIYVLSIDGLAAGRFDELRRRFPHAVLLGTIPAGQRTPNLKPDPDTRIERDDLLVFLARRYADCAPAEIGLPPAPMSSTPPRSPARERRQRTLILGWSRKVPPLLWELDRYRTDGYEVVVVSSTPIETREHLMQQYESREGRVTVRHVESNFAIPRVLQDLDPGGYDNIMVLASERMSEEEEADAMTAATYLMLLELLPEDESRPDVMIELLDPDNVVLFEGTDDDVIVSTEMVSFLLSQVALHRELAAVLHALSRPWGPHIVVEPAARYVELDEPVSFDDVDRAAAAKGEIALGFWREGQRGAGLFLNPDRHATWHLDETDTIVLLSSVAEPGERNGLARVERSTS